MKLNKCFKTVFDQPLKERGFKKKGLLYYRMNGEILQGITIKLINAYSICFNYLPYWLYEEKSHNYKLNESYWAERHAIWGPYFNKNDEETAIKNMEKLKEVVFKKVIPFLDSITDFDSYFDSMLNPVDFNKDLPQQHDFALDFIDPKGYIHFLPSFGKYEFWVKACLDESFDEMKLLNDKMLEKSLEFNRKHLDWGEVYDEEKCIQRYRDYRAEFYKAMEENDFTAGIEFYKKNCAEMKQRLFDDLKITVE